VHVSTKDAARARLRDLRRERVPTRDRASDARAIAIDGLAAAHAAGVTRGDWVAAYESMPIEPPTEALVAALSARGIRVMVPITLPTWELDWREAGTTTALGREAVAQARVVFLPALGVDTSGTRMGKGKGCYDRTVPGTDALLVAVVHPWEVLEEPLPREEHDRRVDAVIAAGMGLRRLRAR
jgi:5-formyltetrahydrofolate cyclo-ligase